MKKITAEVVPSGCSLALLFIKTVIKQHLCKHAALLTSRLDYNFDLSRRAFTKKLAFAAIYRFRYDTSQSKIEKHVSYLAEC